MERESLIQARDIQEARVLLVPDEYGTVSFSALAVWFHKHGEAPATYRSATVASNGELLRRLTVTTSNSYVYDPSRVQALYEQLKPDPDQYGDDPAYAVWAYLHDSLYGADVFEDRGDFDQGFEDEEFDPDA